MTPRSERRKRESLFLYQREVPSKPPEQAFSSSQAVLALVRSHKRNPYDGDDGDDGDDDDG